MGIGGAIASLPYVLHLAGTCLTKSAPLVNAGMLMTGGWLTSVAWRLTPKPGTGDLQIPRPGCFGDKTQLDKRTKRCRDCQMQKECETEIAARRKG